MPRTKKLKVYRMTIGFHDAYVAAPSQKAAAEAWGTDVRVFTHKEAELVTDPKLAGEALANPGKVIKRLRGSADEQVAALGDMEGEQAPAKVGRTSAPRARNKPRPSRAALHRAGEALATADIRHKREYHAFVKREAELERERKALKGKQDQERDRLVTRLAKAEEAYEDAMRRWRE